MLSGEEWYQLQGFRALNQVGCMWVVTYAVSFGVTSRQDWAFRLTREETADRE